mmetsp:Transcript_30052/g.47084  ORF Transcript_30052/g.47084 Transcript_30052/m.47084 type:complete len:696 (-) Transcript_30052:1206-3293(-)
MDFQQTVSVPTKQPEDSGGGGLNRMLGLSGSRGDVPRQRSSSNSFDVAASLFSSMQNLEASGRSLSSLLGGSASSGPLMPLDPQLNLSGHGGFPWGSVGTGQNNNLRHPPRNLMQLIPSAQLGGSLPHQNLGMTDILRQQQQQQIDGNPFQAPPRLDTIGRGYVPSSSKLKGSLSGGSISNSSSMGDFVDVNKFSTQELINELTRRRSDRSRASAVVDAKSAMLSADLFPDTHLMNGGRSQDLRNSSHVNVDLANPYQMQPANPTRRGSEDSLDLLAATANINAVREKVAEDKHTHKSTPSNGVDTMAVRTIPTRFKPARKTAKKKRNNESVLSDVSLASDDEAAANNKKKKAKRNPSSSSLDVLLTALGDDLENLDKKKENKEEVPSILQRESKDELQRRLSKDSIFSSISDEQPSYDMMCQPTMQENLSRKKEQSNLASLFGARSSLSMPSNESAAMLYPPHGMNFDYARRLQTTNSMMASLESEMMRNDLALRQIAFRELQRQQIASRIVQNDLQCNKGPPSPADSKPEQQLHLPEKFTSSGPKKVPLTQCDKPAESKEEKNESISTSIDATGSPLRWNTKAETPIRIPPKEALKIFLSAHGKKGEALREAMLKAISETEGSLADIHSWDRSQGLRKCHNRTVVKTRRSRAQLKAFLTGVEPPKEPHLNRKRQKKKKSKKMDDVFGPPRERW